MLKKMPFARYYFLGAKDRPFLTFFFLQQNHYRHKLYEVNEGTLEHKKLRRVFVRAFKIPMA